MKIAYIDLNSDHYEDYSINPKRYGGGRIFAAYAKEEMDLDIFADEKCFENVSDSENKNHCKPLSLLKRMILVSGGNIKDVIPSIEDYDLIVHHFSNVYINIDGLKCKQIAWSVGYNEVIHEKFDNFMLYNDYQSPLVINTNVKIHKVIIGVPVPEFDIYPKKDYIFQCSRHTNCFGSIQVAKLCIQNNIPCIFAGPIDKNYPLLSYVDDKLIKYVGVISEEEKINFTKYARLYTFLHSWPTPFNLSAIQSLAYGTPIVSTNVGFWPSLIKDSYNGLIKDSYNGFIIENQEQFFKAYQNAWAINPRDCYKTAVNYSKDMMIKSFKSVFEKLYA